MPSLLRQSHLNFLRQQSLGKSNTHRFFSSKDKILESETNDETLNQSDFLSNIRKNILSNSLSSTASNNNEAIHTNKYKQISRIICHIRDEIYTQYPQIIMPTRRMIECLVFNAFRNHNNKNVTAEDWHHLVIETLKNLRDLTDSDLTERGTEGYCDFTETDGVTRLFPSFELFDEWDAHKFSQTLLYHLDKELN
ncbi:MAG: hypothetical protein K6L75_08300 [Cellvibrionaceae bacterium]